jgi:GNAT superfamily N-acetyltransferase
VKSADLASGEQAPARRSVLRRLLGRLRHGLLTQELLGRLARLGVVITPYFVSLEPPPPDAIVAPDARCSARLLSSADTAEIIRISLDEITEAQIAALVSQGAGCGVFYDGKLAGYNWALMDHLPVPGSGQALIELQPDEAYLFNMYVAPTYRGLRLAGYLRQALHQELLRRGRTRFYSISTAFNRSSRRFKSRLDVREIELRLYLHLRPKSLRGVDLRLWRSPPHLSSPRLKRVAPVTMAQYGD